VPGAANVAAVVARHRALPCGRTVSTPTFQLRPQRRRARGSTGYNYPVRNLVVVLAAFIGCGGDSTKVDPAVTSAVPNGSSAGANGSNAGNVGSNRSNGSNTGAAATAGNTGSNAGSNTTIAGSNATGSGSGSAAGSNASAPLAAGGADLLPYVKHLYDVVACGLDGKLPDDMAKADTGGKLAAVVKQHCDQLRPYIAKFRTTYFDSARAWFVEREPKDLPKTVVYPFGGGDLISLLVPFPDATDYTTISLELAGDPRHLGELDANKLRDSLHNWSVDIGPVINIGMNSSVNLSDEQRNVLAAQLSSHLLGLVTGGYEVVAARYFTLDDQGAVHYVEQAQLDADTKQGKSMSGNWKSPDGSHLSPHRVEPRQRAPQVAARLAPLPRRERQGRARRQRRGLPAVEE